MMNNAWEKRILRAAKSKNTTAIPDKEVIEAIMIDDTKVLINCVKDNEKIMKYLQSEDAAGHAHILDFLLASLNVNQHLREAFLNAEVIDDIDAGHYVIRFPFGVKTIQYILAKKAVSE